MATLEAAARVRPSEANDSIRTWTRVASGLVGFAPVLGLAAAQGGFFPTSWGWASIPLLWVVALVLVLRSEIRIGTAERALFAASIALTGWIALSAWWSVAPAESVLELERALVYAAGVAAVLLVTRTRHVRYLLGGIAVAISLIAAFSLATRLLPDRVGVFDNSVVYRLAQPIGYWNGLALFAAMGALLALAFAARARTIAVRCASFAVLVVLLPTFYFTFGRAAWVALAVGFLAAVAVDPKRLQLLATAMAVAPAAAVGVWIASRRPGLTHGGTSLAQATHDGHRVALWLLLLALSNAVAAAAFAFVERRVSISRLGRLAFGSCVVLAAVIAVATVFVRYGGPVALVHKGYSAFKAPPPHASSGNLNRRLLSFSGNGRSDFWRLAWDDARQHPVLGAGAGTYGRYFLVHQPRHVGFVRDAHGLYVETLAELGPLGLALLLTFLAIPFFALRTARRHPLVPGAFGAYVAYLVHTGVDWDWELAGVTVAGLACGAAIVIAARRGVRRRPLSAPLRWGGVAAAVAAAAFAGVALVGNLTLSRSESALEQKHLANAAAKARRAHAWMPWSPTPWVALGRAQLAAHQLPDAQQSFHKAIAIDSGDWELWYRLATATSGRVRRHALRRAAALYPRAGLAPNPAPKRTEKP
jgi:O-Antigen ligase